jgi:hypothetical protein
MPLTPPKHPGGRPPIYSSAADLKIAVDKYFTETKTPVYDKTGEIVDYKEGPYTLSGLGRAIGASRITLLRYEAKDEDMNAVIADARARVEEYAEGRLYDRDGSNGAKFALENNHEGWKAASQTAPSALLTADDALRLIGGIVGLLNQVQHATIKDVTPSAIAIDSGCAPSE